MVFSMFFRISNAVLAHDLVAELQLDAVSLGMLAGAFFYSFALVQIPLGPMLDRFGPRSVLTLFALIGASGSLLFGMSTSFVAAIIGRVLMGTGMACVLMGSLKTFSVKFSHDRFARLSGGLIAVGTGGSLLAASPLALMASVMGWRNVFLLAAAVTALLALFFFVVVGKPEEHETSHGSEEPRMPLGTLIRLVFGTLSFWQICGIALCRYGTFVALQGLWLGVYLMDVRRLTPVQAGHVLAIIAVAMGIGSLAAGYLSDKVFRSRKVVALWGSIFYSLSLFPLTGIVPVRSMVWFCVFSAFIGFFSGFGNLAYAHVKDIFPGHMSATVMSWVNFFVMAGGAVLTPLLGKVIDTFPHTGLSYPPEAYHLAFLICFLAMAASTIFYVFSKADRTFSGQ